MGNFLETIEQWVDDTKQTIDNILQDVVFMVGESVVTLSPVDTGRFRGNWQLSIDSTASSSLVRYDQDGHTTLAEIKSTAKTFTAGQVAYIQNHVLYGNDLEWGLYNGPTQKVTEEGFSTQAPAGMVRVTEAQFLEIVAAAVRKNV